MGYIMIQNGRYYSVGKAVSIRCLVDYMPSRV
jgi:hypothetical protein